MRAAGGGGALAAARGSLKRLSLSSKLAALLFAIVALAFAAMYFSLVPPLESNLQAQKLRDLERTAGGSSEALQDVMGRDIPARELNGLVRAVADGAGAQVTLLGVQRSAADDDPEAPRFYTISDSRAGGAVPLNDGLAARAVRTGRPATATVRFAGAELGQAAQPLAYRGSADWVALYSVNLGDVVESVGLVRGRVLAAGGLALVIALVGAYAIARRLARRVDRLEGAATEVTRGRFIDPLPVDSEDELGRLTRTFNEMQEQLARVDRARKEFIANASHELRTPIFSLGGFVELLRDEELDPGTRDEFLRSMAEQVGRLQKLAVDLLDLSRLDAGSLEIEPDEVDLAELARDVAGEFAPAAGRHGTELELELPEGGVPALCDRRRAAQIVRILLDNALTHTPEGTRVTVRAGGRDGVAEVAVADSGPGVEGEAVDQVFERFYTGDAARGSGLGLAIARELAERMSGRVELRSAPGRTTFALRLPR